MMEVLIIYYIFISTLSLIHAALLTTQVYWIPTDTHREYGDICNESHTCDKQKHLVCINGLCVCYPNYYRDSEGLCSLQKPIGEECDNHFECSSALGLTCWRGRCGCDPTHSRRQGVKCVGFPGGPCVEEECDLNSRCEEDSKICNCEPKFVFIEHDKKCKGRLGMECTDKSYCLDQFDCVDQQCTCRSNQVYDSAQGKCLSIVSETCYEDDDCVPNAICTLAGVHANAVTVCKCKEGFFEHGPGFCRNGFGSKCLPTQMEWTYLVAADSLLASNASDVHVSTESLYNDWPDNMVPISVVNNICDETRKLRCYSGKCGCNLKSEVFDAKRGRCIGLVGTLCDTSEDFHTNCVQYAHCRPLANLRHDGLGRCTCSTGYEIGPNRTCIRSGRENVIDIHD